MVRWEIPFKMNNSKQSYILNEITIGDLCTGESYLLLSSHIYTRYNRYYQSIGLHWALPRGYLLMHNLATWIKLYIDAVGGRMVSQ